MYSVPAPILNQIAKTQKLKTPGAKILFSLNEEEKIEALDQQMDALEKAKVPQPVAFLYLTLGPLLAENEAISHYIVQTENSDLRMCLPEVTSVPEALRIAKLEKPGLTKPELLKLALMLRRLDPSSAMPAR